MSSTGATAGCPTSPTSSIANTTPWKGCRGRSAWCATIASLGLSVVTTDVAIDGRADSENHYYTPRGHPTKASTSSWDGPEGSWSLLVRDLFGKTLPQGVYYLLAGEVRSPLSPSRFANHLATLNTAASSSSLHLRAELASGVV